MKQLLAIKLVNQIQGGRENSGAKADLNKTL